MNENTFAGSFFFRFNLFCLIVFLFYLHFCVLGHFKKFRCIVKSLIDTSMKFLSKYNWKKKTRKVFFGHQSLGVQTSIPVSQTAWICHYIGKERWNCLELGKLNLLKLTVEARKQHNLALYLAFKKLEHAFVYFMVLQTKLVQKQ